VPRSRIWSRKAGSSRETSFRWNGAGRGLPGEPIFRPGSPPLPREPGFIESRQGDGTYIARKPSSPGPPLASVILTEKDDQMELFEMRRMIEPDLAYLAAERATEEEIAMMEKVSPPARTDRPRDFERTWTGISITSWRGGEKQGPPAHHRQHHGPPRGEPRAVSPGGGKTPEIHFAPQGSARSDPCQGPERAEKCMLEHLWDIETSLFGPSGRRRSKRGIVTSLEKGGEREFAGQFAPIRIGDKRRRMDTMADVFEVTIWAAV